MRKENRIQEHFSRVETETEYKGNRYNIGDALTLLILGSLCGLQTVSQIHQWARSKRVLAFWGKHFEIVRIPCYYWLLCLINMVKPASLNQCFMRWVQTMLPEEGGEITLSFDGKTIRSTGAMPGYERPLHIISAHIAELGLTLGQQAVAEKSNETPALRELLQALQMEGCMVVTDALHCQKETAEAVVAKGADYLLSVKDNQETLKSEIVDYVQEESPRKTMDTAMTVEKNGGRIEKRTANSTADIAWSQSRETWAHPACIGAIHRRCETRGVPSDAWHYYISSRPLTATDLLRLARMEWSVETMHWLLDIHFAEDFCRVEDETAQLNLNMILKVALNSIRSFKNHSGSKRPLSKITFDCLLDPTAILPLLQT